MRNLKIVLMTLLLACILITVTTLYKVQKRHEERLVLVTEKRITEGATNCYWDDVCKDSYVTLGELIELGYAKEEVNPITKMYYSHNSYIEKDGNTYTFHEAS